MLTALFTNLINSWLRKKNPYHTVKEYTPAELKILDDKYYWWFSLTSFMMFALLILLGIGYAKILFLLYIGIQSISMAVGSTFFPVSWPTFCLPGVFIAIATLDFFIRPVQKFFLRDKFKEFEDYFNYVKGTKYGYDNNRIVKRITRSFLYLGIFSLFFVLPARVLVSGKDIVYKSIFQIKERHYFFYQVASIVHFDRKIQKSNPVYDSHYKIYFKNGDAYNTSFSIDDDEEADKFAELVSQNSHLHVEKRDIDTDN